MPSLISVLSSHGSSRIAHALSTESRLRPNAIATNASGGDNASVKLPASLSLLFGPAAPPLLQQQHQQPLAPFQQQFHQQFLPQLTTVQQPPTPRAAESQYFSAKPAEHGVLHLIHGNGHDLRRRQQDATSNTFPSTSSASPDVSVPSTPPLADLILDYLEEEGCDEDSSDTWIAADTLSSRAPFGYDRVMVNSAQNGTEGQFHGMATALAPLQPAQYGAHAARMGLEPAHRGEDSNRRLSGDDSLERQMRSAHSQLRMVQSLATTTTPLEAALYADVISAMTDARARHAEASKSSRDIISSSPASLPRPSPASQGMGGSALNAAVAGRLRAMGYDAAVCTTQWDNSPTVPEGTYEYIDVLVTDVPSTDALATVNPPSTEYASRLSTLLASPSTARGVTSATSPTPLYASANGTSATRATPTPASSTLAPAAAQRFIIDLDFRAQFQIARPTSEYTSIIESTPLIYVGRQERLARLVEVVSDTMRGALRAQGMHIAPWRRWEYLNAKWMGGSKRKVVGEGKAGEGTETETETGGFLVTPAAALPAAASISKAAVTATPAATSPFVPAPAAATAPTAVSSSRMGHLAPAASHNWCFEVPGCKCAAIPAAIQQLQQELTCFPSNVDAILFQGKLIPARSFAAAQG